MTSENREHPTRYMIEDTTEKWSATVKLTIVNSQNAIEDIITIASTETIFGMNRSLEGGGTKVLRDVEGVLLLQGHILDLIPLLLDLSQLRDLGHVLDQYVN
mmetsp:Transcript_28397/g.31414  ORF Transcript_28397/g.31414 Transcript_28397/m.31414 type:complete len:102 (+) Transcript_28397:730-1035(+)